MRIICRVLQSALFGLKWLLKERGYEKKALWVDSDTNALSIGDDPVATTRIDNKNLIVEPGQGFEEYFEDPSWKDIIAKAAEKLTKGSEKGEKGATKGQGKVGRKGAGGKTLR